MAFTEQVYSYRNEISHRWTLSTHDLTSLCNWLHWILLRGFTVNTCQYFSDFYLYIILEMSYFPSTLKLSTILCCSDVVLNMTYTDNPIFVNVTDVQDWKQLFNMIWPSSLMRWGLLLKLLCFQSLDLFLRRMSMGEWLGSRFQQFLWLYVALLWLHDCERERDLRDRPPLDLHR